MNTTPFFFVVSVITALITASIIKQRIKQYQYFSGAGWGVVCGILSGIIFVLFAHTSINKTLDSIDFKKKGAKKYAKYARNEMAEFTKYFGIFLIIKILIICFAFMNVYSYLYR